MATKKPDARLQEDILDELKWDSRVDANDVGVTVHQGVVTLTGTVASLAKKLAAADAAHRVAGVLDVANDIHVRAPDGERPSDADIAAAVRHALVWDAQLRDDRIQSTVSDGIVVLTGAVDLTSQRDDAARAVGRLPGVVGVDNQIVVHRPRISEVTVRAAIHEALARHADRDASRINIEVDGGRVTLTGDVHSWLEREAIVGAARGTQGVEAVVDRMRLG